MPKSTSIDEIIAKYITRETHKGSVNRIRHLMKVELDQLLVEARIDELRDKLPVFSKDIDYEIWVSKRLQALTSNDIEIIVEIRKPK